MKRQDREPEKAGKSAARKDRLAEALRSNLQRRKAQERARKSGSEITRETASEAAGEAERARKGGS